MVRLVSDAQYNSDKEIRVVLLENIHQTAVDYFTQQGFHVEHMKQSFAEADLIEIVKTAHIIGVRSKTQITANVLNACANLEAVGCFCIGTDQVDLSTAASMGVPVFNAPFANTRSVAELVIAEIVMLARKAGDRSMQLHEGVWEKSASGCFEVRGKTLGIIGYGHIGSQVSVLAESMGMNVIYYDISPKLPLGNAQSIDKMDDVLAAADFITVHVPKTDLTRGMFSRDAFEKMKKGAYFINNARGNVADLDALADLLKSGHIAGAAVDVFPKEPKANGPGFECPLIKCPNVILTPHIGGSTMEAQERIGTEVGSALTSFMKTGCTMTSVNFPKVDLPPAASATHRLINVHDNKPGALMSINNIFADMGCNIVGQVLGTSESFGYLIVDVAGGEEKKLHDAVAALPTSTKTRTLF
eukprot:Rmarinus@m.12860